LLLIIFRQWFFLVVWCFARILPLCSFLRVLWFVFNKFFYYSRKNDKKHTTANKIFSRTGRAKRWWKKTANLKNIVLCCVLFFLYVASCPADDMSWRRDGKKAGAMYIPAILYVLYVSSLILCYCCCRYTLFLCMAVSRKNLPRLRFI
jgi:hypothetical protein